MGATLQTVTYLHEVGKTYSGSWTTESTKGDHTIRFERPVLMVLAILDSGGTNPNVLVKHADETNESLLISGATTADTSSAVAVSTSPADSAGITITNASNGTCTVAIDSTSQVNSGTNQWIVWCKP